MTVVVFITLYNGTKKTNVSKMADGEILIHIYIYSVFEYSTQDYNCSSFVLYACTLAKRNYIIRVLPLDQVWGLLASDSPLVLVRHHTLVLLALTVLRGGGEEDGG